MDGAREDGDYWFAHYRLSPSRSRGIAPLNWKGRAVIGGFVAMMVLGGLSFLMLGLHDQMFAGVLTFAVLAAAAGALFLCAVAWKSDPQRTVTDYQRGKLG